MEKYTEPITDLELVPVVVGNKAVVKKAYAKSKG